MWALKMMVGLGRLWLIPYVIGRHEYTSLVIPVIGGSCWAFVGIVGQKTYTKTLCV